MQVLRQMAEDRLERKVAVILATDVIGCSKHVEDNESLTIRTYRSHEAILLDLIEDFRGRGMRLFLPVTAKPRD
jgi:adenylate cyclase